MTLVARSNCGICRFRCLESLEIFFRHGKVSRSCDGKRSVSRDARLLQRSDNFGYAGAAVRSWREARGGIHKFLN